jgi:ribosome-associated translation inhibitor RaiA
MEKPVVVTFRGMAADEAVEALCLEGARSLERYFDHITSCRVTVSVPHHHHHNQGNRFDVRIALSVPGQELVVDHEAGGSAAKEDSAVTVRAAFDRARRVLEDYARKLRGDVKSHAAEKKRV